jgi:hypothetical protein
MVQTEDQIIISKLRKNQQFQRQSELNLISKRYNLDVPLNFAHLNSVTRAGLMPKLEKTYDRMATILFLKCIQHHFSNVEYFNPPWLMYLKNKGATMYLQSVANEQKIKILIITHLAMRYLPKSVQNYLTEFVYFSPMIINTMMTDYMNQLNSLQKFNECMQYLMTIANGIEIPKKRKQNKQSGRTVVKRTRFALGHGSQSVKDHTMVIIQVSDDIRIVFNVRMYTKTYKDLYEFIINSKEYNELCANKELVDSAGNSFKEFTQKAKGFIILNTKYLNLTIKHTSNTEFKLRTDVKTICMLKDLVVNRSVTNNILQMTCTVKQSLDLVEHYCKAIPYNNRHSTTLELNWGCHYKLFDIHNLDTTMMLIKAWMNDPMKLRSRSPENINSFFFNIKILTKLNITGVCDDCRTQCNHIGIQHLNQNNDQAHLIYVHRAGQLFCLPQ